MIHVAYVVNVFDALAALLQKTRCRSFIYSDIRRPYSDRIFAARAAPITAAVPYARFLRSLCAPESDLGDGP
jgi:hypothetical protein